MTGPAEVETLLDTVRRWAASRSDIEGVLLVGSWASGTAGPGSDVDLVILAGRPDDLLSEQAWLAEMGEVQSVEPESWGRVRSLRVVYEEVVEVEYGITDPGWLAEPIDPGTEAVLQHGVKLVWANQAELASRLEPFIRPDRRGGGAGS